ncbi:MAG: hypothetical protein H7343_12255 [Undibacterium sp.]|nr:hypothetical protein [Opitutaceae bacterium]
MKLRALLLFLLGSLALSRPVARGQPTPTPTATALTVNKTSGAITAPVAAATFASANGLTGTTALNGYFADPTANASFAAATWRTRLSLGTLATQSGTFSGVSSGTNTGDQTTISGNAATATTLQTARTINGIAFDGSANITISGSGVSSINTRATGGGLALDGTASNAAGTIDNTALAYGLDDFSHYLVTKRFTYAPAVEISLVEKAAANLGWRFRLTTGGYLRLQIGNGTNFTTNQYTSSVPVASAAFKTGHFAFTASRAGNVTFYENGAILGTVVAMAGSVAQTATSIGSLRIGYDGTTSDAGIWLRHTAYNLALGAADITEIYEGGGAVPERFKTPYLGVNYWASQVSLVKTLTLGTWTAGSIVGNVITASTASTGFIYGGVVASGAFTPGRYRIGYDLVLNSGAAPAFGDGSAYSSARMTAGTGMFFDLTTIGTAPYLYYINGFAASNFVLTINGIVRMGAVAHYDGDDLNASYQWSDRGTNNLHALRTANGGAPTKQILGPFPVRLTSDGTTAAQQLGGGTLFPANCQILRIRARAPSGTPSITLGSSSGGSQFVASIALSTTWKDLTIALAGGINSSASAVWLTASTASVIEVQITAETLSP